MSIPAHTWHNMYVWQAGVTWWKWLHGSNLDTWLVKFAPWARHSLTWLQMAFCSLSSIYEHPPPTKVWNGTAYTQIYYPWELCPRPGVAQTLLNYSFHHSWLLALLAGTDRSSSSATSRGLQVSHSCHYLDLIIVCSLLPPIRTHKEILPSAFTVQSIRFK